jgi:hypothetical protein
VARTTRAAQEGIVQASEAGDPTLYCYLFIMPSGMEPKLTTKMYERQIGPFGCDAYDILSNASFNIGQAVTTVVPGSFSCEHGGKWGTALNTENFIRVWQTMFSLGQWQSYDWSIKNDADAVFFPPRFLDLVTGRSGLMAAVPTGPVYLNNCQWGMHGPVEAVSNEAMGMYFQSGTTVCADILQRAMTSELPAGADEAEYSFGEDQFMRECLEELGVTKVDAMPHILSERYACGERPQDCGDARVTFHAFKNVPEFMVCLNYAEVTGESSWPVYHKASDAAVAASQIGWMAPEDAAEAVPQEGGDAQAADFTGYPAET